MTHGEANRQLGYARGLRDAPLPQPIKFTYEEGGAWIDWEERNNTVVHSIIFDNGKSFDVVNGWRDGNFCTECGGRRL